MYFSLQRQVFILTVLLMCSAGFAVPCQAGETPLSAVTAAQKAIENSDVDMFNKAVDVDSILQKSSGVLLSVLAQKIQTGEITKVNPMLALAFSSLNSQDTAQVEMLRTLIGSEVKSFINTGISGGHFAGKPNGKSSGKGGVFSGLFKDISKGRKELVPGKILSQSGGNAKISATMIDHGAGKFPLELGLVKKDGQWRVNEITNTRSLLDGALKSAR